MRHRTFFWFMLPSVALMLLFIAAPIVSVAIQSLHVEHERVLIVTESCGPFGCTASTSVDQEATRALREAEPLGRFNGLGTYLNRAHLATEELVQAWRSSGSPGEFAGRVMNLPFYSALAFTLVYTFVVTPLIVVLGFLVALGVDTLPRRLKGPSIFLSLLPMLVTPLVGSLILFWMIDADGILGATLQRLTGDPELSLKASKPLTWVTLFVYGVWHGAPFAFIVFYAGLQTVPRDTLEAAMVDGASRWERVRQVTLPHLAPLTTFILLIELMNNFRVFEPIVGFSAGANATSLSYAIFDDLQGEYAQFGSAAATSMLTIAGVAVLLTPVLVRTWRDFGRRRA